MEIISETTEITPAAIQSLLFISGKDIAHVTAAETNPRTINSMAKAGSSGKSLSMANDKPIIDKISDATLKMMLITGITLFIH